MGTRNERSDDGVAIRSVRALRKLLHDIQHRQIDCVLVYKVDRLNRSLSDFGRRMEIFEGHKVPLVIVMQPFDTTISPPAATLR